MDDCSSGTDGPKDTRLTVDDIQNAGSKGGFSVKGFVKGLETHPSF